MFERSKGSADIVAVTIMATEGAVDKVSNIYNIQLLLHRYQ